MCKVHDTPEKDFHASEFCISLSPTQYRWLCVVILKSHNFICQLLNKWILLWVSSQKQNILENKIVGYDFQSIVYHFLLIFCLSWTVGVSLSLSLYLHVFPSLFFSAYIFIQADCCWEHLGVCMLSSTVFSPVLDLSLIHISELILLLSQPLFYNHLPEFNS